MRKIDFGLIILALLAFAVLFPILFMFANSFMGVREAAARYGADVTPYNILHTGDTLIHYAEISLVPEVITLSSYDTALLREPLYHRLFWNSVLITVPILLGQLIISPFAAFGFESLRSKYKELLFFVYILVMLMPIQLLMVPHYITAEAFGYNNTYWAIILPGIFSPFGAFLIRQQLKGFDKSLLEAARTEGASEWLVFWKIVLPSLRPTMAALTILTFAECWNIVDQAVVFIKDTYNEPMSVYLSRIISSNPGLIFALSCVYMIPAIIIFLNGQDHLAHGIALSAAKK